MTKAFRVVVTDGGDASAARVRRCRDPWRWNDMAQSTRGLMTAVERDPDSALADISAAPPNT